MQNKEKVTKIRRKCVYLQKNSVYYINKHGVQ